MSRTTFWPDASCLRPGNGHSHRVEGRAWLVCSTKQRELRNDATRFVPASKLLRHIQTTHQLFQLYQLDSSAVANCRLTPAHHLQGAARLTISTLARGSWRQWTPAGRALSGACACETAAVE